MICCGGGGIPVLESGQGAEAVIDKDLAAALLAEQIDADGLAILTDADAVYEHWGTPCSDRSAKRRRKSWRLCPRRRRDGAENRGGKRLRAPSGQAGVDWGAVAYR